MVDYHFEEVQSFRVVVYDADDQKHLDDLQKQEFIGEAEFKLADVVTAGKVLTKKLASSSENSLYQSLTGHLAWVDFQL